jgi:hypothetical protein
MYSVSRELVEDLIIGSVDKDEYTGRWNNEAFYFIVQESFCSHLISSCDFTTLRTVQAYSTNIIGVEQIEIDNLQHEHEDFQSRSGVRSRDVASSDGSPIHLKS